MNGMYEMNELEFVLEESGSFELVEPTDRLTLTKRAIIPGIFVLHQNYPNPFNPVTTIRYDLPEESDVTLTIYDITGRIVKTLVQETQQAGIKNVVWNAIDVSSGVYIYRIKAMSYTQTHKMILLK